MGAKRVVLDTVEALFGALRNEAMLRAELRRLFRWLNDRGVTAIVTGERGERTLTRHGLEEYVSDCVIVPDHRVNDQISTRRLRVVKYRGSHHGPDEYPFLIDRTGFSVLPVSAMGLEHAASSERVPTGVAELDAMLEGGGYYRGSSVLLSGTPGAGRRRWARASWRLGVSAGSAVCCSPLRSRRRRSCATCARSGLICNRGLRREGCGSSRLVRRRTGWRPIWRGSTRRWRSSSRRCVVLDPLSTLEGEGFQIKSMLSRLIDAFKTRQIAALMTTMTRGSSDERAGLGISSVIDTWLDLSNFELDGERNRGINVLKSRGMGHSNQVREFLLSSSGIEIRDVYTGGRACCTRAVLVGSARRAQELRDRAEADAYGSELDAKRRRLRVPPLRVGGPDCRVARSAGGGDARALQRDRRRQRREQEIEQDRAAIAAARRAPGCRATDIWSRRDEPRHREAEHGA